MSAFYDFCIDRIVAMMDANNGIFFCCQSNLAKCFLPGFSVTDLRAIAERGIADGTFGGYGHRYQRGNRYLAIASAKGPALSGFRTGFSTRPDNATCYAVLHPDREGRAIVAKFGRTKNIKKRKHALFPDASRQLTDDEIFSIDSANATQAEQVLRLSFSLLTVGGENRRTMEYVRAPHFEGDVTRNIGTNARGETIALMTAATKIAVSEIGALETIDRHNPTQRAKIANRLVRQLSMQFDVRAARTEAGHLSFAR